MLAQVVTGFWNLGLGGSIPAITGVEFGLQYQDSMGAGKCGASHLIISGYPDQSLQNCFRADSIEPIFDASSRMYIDFLDAVLNAAPQFQQAGYISLRWSKTTNATMSMHNFPSAMAVAIEVTSLKGLPGNASWMSRLHSLAVSHAGRPHWGQINQLDAPTTAALYGASLTAWRNTLGALVGSSGIFSNAFTMQRGLEPQAGTGGPTIFGKRAIDVMADFMPAIDLLLEEDVAAPVKPPHIPTPPRPPHR